jgi:hypothetical protein
MRELKQTVVAAIHRGVIAVIGDFETRWITAEEMFTYISREPSRVGYWAPNLFSCARICPTNQVKFKLAVLGGQIHPDNDFQIGKIKEMAIKEFGLQEPTFGMGYYLWESMCRLLMAHRKINGFTRLVVCHLPIRLGNNICDRVMSIDNNLVVRGEIGGPGHHFDSETGFVFQIPC